VDVYAPNAVLQTFVLDRSNAEEFLEVYKGVLPEYSETLNELNSGVLIALEVWVELYSCHDAYV
jgi:hypothetical protein